MRPIWASGMVKQTDLVEEKNWRLNGDKGSTLAGSATFLRFKIVVTDGYFCLERAFFGRRPCRSLLMRSCEAQAPQFALIIRTLITVCYLSRRNPGPSAMSLRSCRVTLARLTVTIAGSNATKAGSTTRVDRPLSGSMTVDWTCRPLQPSRRSARCAFPTKGVHRSARLRSRARRVPCPPALHRPRTGC